jgi:squalene monooxygenase
MCVRVRACVRVRDIPTRECVCVCAGGECAAGPMSLLSGLNPSPNTLVTHFFKIAFFAMKRILVRDKFHGIWLAVMILWVATNIIVPIILVEGVR